MRKSGSGSGRATLALAVLCVLLTAAAPLSVWPRSAASLTPIGLGELVTKALPQGDQLGWDHLQDGRILWVTDGIEFGTNHATRYGLARVRHTGQLTRLLRQRWEELAWTVELSTEGNAKWGPTTVLITPGLQEPSYKGNYICFGTGFEGCEFPLSAIKHPSLRLTQRCRIGSGAGNSIVMSASTKDGRRGTVVYSGSGGTGGYANHVEVTTLDPLEYCRINRDRGY